MSKAYLLLIGALVIVVLGVGTFAYFRSTQNPASSPALPGQTNRMYPNQPAPSTPPSSNPNEPAVNPTQNEISLSVSSPTNGQVASTPTITVTGKTVPNADIAVNDQDIKADAGGNFSATLTLEEGDNDVFVTASNDTGQSSDWNATVTYTPAQ